MLAYEMTKVISRFEKRAKTEPLISLIIACGGENEKESSKLEHTATIFALPCLIIRTD